MDDELYLKRMEQSLVEKLWFTKRVNLKQYDLIIDFGCANGFLLSHLSYFPFEKETKFVGYDNNANLIAKLNWEKIRHRNIGGTLTYNWDIVLGYLQLSKKSLIIFSSVMHEMGNEEIKEKLNDLVIYGVDTICIRDMCFEMDKHNIINKDWCWDDNGNPYNKDLMYLTKSKWFEECEIETQQKTLTEHLLKYPYIENYERESKEEYFSTDFDDVKNQLKNGGYEDFMMFHYTNNYIKNRVKEDFGIDLTHKTHILALFTRKEI